MKSVSHIINITRLLGLYSENIGPSGLCRRDRAATSHFFLVRNASSSGYSTPLTSNSTLLPQKKIQFNLLIIPLNSTRGNTCEICISSNVIQFFVSLIQYFSHCCNSYRVLHGKSQNSAIFGFKFVCCIT